MYPDLGIHSLKIKNVKPARKVEFEGGYQQQRPKFTRKYKTFEFEHKFLNDAQAQELETFFDNNQGLEFEFTHPKTLEAFNVTFQMDSLDFEYAIGGLYQQCKIMLREQ